MPEQPWQKREDETSKAFAAFTVYRNMGPERSLDKVRQELGRPSGYTRHLEKWSSEHDWVERAEAYDESIIAEASQQVRDDQVSEVEEMIDRHQSLTKMVQKILAPAMRYLDSLEIEEVMPQDPDLEDVLDYSNKIALALNRVIPRERESFDKPGEITEERMDRLNDELEQIYEEEYGEGEEAE